MMDFTFEKPAWELALDTMRRGSSMPASRFLALMEPEIGRWLSSFIHNEPGIWQSKSPSRHRCILGII